MILVLVHTKAEILLAISLSVWPTIIHWCSEHLTKSVSDWFAKFRRSWKSENWKAFWKVDFQQEVSCWQLHYLPLWLLSSHIYMSTGFCAPHSPRWMWMINFVILPYAAELPFFLQSFSGTICIRLLHFPLYSVQVNMYSLARPTSHRYYDWCLWKVLNKDSESFDSMKDISLYLFKPLLQSIHN